MSVTEDAFWAHRKLCVKNVRSKSLLVWRCLHVSCSLDAEREMELEDAGKGVWRLELEVRGALEENRRYCRHTKAWRI